MRYKKEYLYNVAMAFLKATGSDDYEAPLVADHLIKANLRGHDSHGIGMLAQYAGFLKDGRLRPNTAPTVKKDAGAILQFEGNRGYGQRVGYDATNMAIERAKKTGICMYTIARTCHLGRIGTYGEQAVAQGMVSVHFVNVNHFGVLVAPFSGSKARFGTNPFCCSIPATDKYGPFILDFATSIVALGKTRVAWLAGTEFDEQVILDPQGHPTANPTCMWEGERGALMAFAKHKGSGLCWACELMAGILSGGETIQPGHPQDGSIVNNMTAFIIDPAALCDLDWMKREIDAMNDYVKSSPAPDPVNNPVLMPGEIERIRTADRSARGVEISDNEMAAIRRVSLEAGVPREVLDYTD